MLAELTASWLLSMIRKSFPSLVLNHSVYTFLVMVKTKYLLQFEHVLGKLILYFYLWHPQNTLFIPQPLRIIIYTQQGLSYYAMQDWADSLDYFHALAFDYHFCRNICTAYALDETTLKLRIHSSSGRLLPHRISYTFILLFVLEDGKWYLWF